MRAPLSRILISAGLCALGVATLARAGSCDYNQATGPNGHLYCDSPCVTDIGSYLMPCSFTSINVIASDCEEQGTKRADYTTPPPGFGNGQSLMRILCTTGGIDQPTWMCGHMMGQRNVDLNCIWLIGDCGTENLATCP